MKKIINQPQTLIEEMLNGLVLSTPSLELLPEYKVISRKQKKADKVCIISGGGSGHEPAHAGFVGSGMLDAAVCGDVFASPSQIQVYQAIRQNAGNKGVLLIIKNYSGDMMNFKNAAYLAAEDGITIDFVRVDDDIAVEDSLFTVGRRGVAGTVFVHKIAGAAAEQGRNLTDVKYVAEKAAANVRSLGFALTSCTVPAKGSPTFELETNEIEFGVGIHGEPGIKREKILSADQLAERMTVSLCADLGIGKKSTQNRVAVLVNGFGATPLMELYLLYNAVAEQLNQLDVQVSRCFVGNYMTSIDMAGASVSILKLDDELEKLLNEPCNTPGFSVNGPVEQMPYFNYFGVPKDRIEGCFTVETPDKYAKIGNKLTLNNMQYILDVMAESIIRNETPFCELDAYAGDGDFGMSIAKGFRKLKRHWKKITADASCDIGSFLLECSMIIMEYCGGASGPIWGSAFRSAGHYTLGKKTLNVVEFSEMLYAAIKGIQASGERSFGRGAQIGDKTLIDALVPCADSWRKCAQNGANFINAFNLGAAAAVEGSKKTASIIARMGRAGTVGERSLGYPDAGAHALGVIFTDISHMLTD